MLIALGLTYFVLAAVLYNLRRGPELFDLALLLLMGAEAIGVVWAFTLFVRS